MHPRRHEHSRTCKAKAFLLPYQPKYAGTEIRYQLHFLPSGNFFAARYNCAAFRIHPACFKVPFGAGQVQLDISSGGGVNQIAFTGFENFSFNLYKMKVG